MPSVVNLPLAFISLSTTASSNHYTADRKDSASLQVYPLAEYSSLRTGKYLLYIR